MKLEKEADKLSLEEVKDIVESEGLGYAVLHYLRASRIKDAVLKELWYEAYRAMSKLEEFLEDQ